MSDTAYRSPARSSEGAEEAQSPVGVHRSLQPDTDPVVALARTLRRVKGSFSSGEKLDYDALRKSAEFQESRRLLAELQTFDPLRSGAVERQRAFWINLYNLLIVHGVIELGVRGSVWRIPAFFNRAATFVNGRRFSASDIEHGVLRANAGHPLWPGRQFRPGDPRRKYVLPLDPRIHFALNCASISCPPIGAYDADRLDVQLEMATRSFINSGGVRIDVSSGEVRLSRIFLWYARDFVGPVRRPERCRALLAFIAPYVADEEARRFLQQPPASLRLTYQPYDWGLNAI